MFFKKPFAAAFEIHNGRERLGRFGVRHYARQIQTTGIPEFGMDQTDFHGQRFYVVILDELRKGQNVLADLNQPLGKQGFRDVFAFHIRKQYGRDVIKVVTAVYNQRFKLAVHKRSVCGGNVAFFRGTLFAIGNNPIQQGGRRRHYLFQKRGNGRVKFRRSIGVESVIIPVSIGIELEHPVRRFF